MNYAKLMEYLQKARPDIRACLTRNNFSENLVSDATVHIAQSHFEQIVSFIAEVEKLRENPSYEAEVLKSFPGDLPAAKNFGLFMSYDFHITESGPKLIEINTNASGSTTVQLMRESLGAEALPNLPADFFLDIRVAFENEYHVAQLARPLKTIAIVDDDPQSQKAFYEFLIYQKFFEKWGYQCLIADASKFKLKGDRLEIDGVQIDFIYNRSTDFYFEKYPELLAAYKKNCVCVSPHPREYHLLANKKRLMDLQSPEFFNRIKVVAPPSFSEMIPETRPVSSFDEGEVWSQRKKYFFKPSQSFGAKAVYKGASMTRKVFSEVLAGDYIAQEVAEPGAIETPAGKFKYDLRFYSYRGQVQLVGARVFQGQLLNFRTVGGGFALVALS